MSGGSTDGVSAADGSENTMDMESGTGVGSVEVSHVGDVWRESECDEDWLKGRLAAGHGSTSWPSVRAVVTRNQFISKSATAALHVIIPKIEAYCVLAVFDTRLVKIHLKYGKEYQWRGINHQK
ncbi:hypothetical protein EV421DRAFT_1747569 [Armillaria borealis]|uniref:Uncharacterized protein n=1 Tax=Armillaria borealis TaxID=47425 RepID=A0AA39IBX6_9AGAR|nr:hypothetical protein EV421DRAFT_1747569 [Armillaria borealis]